MIFLDRFGYRRKGRTMQLCDAEFSQAQIRKMNTERSRSVGSLVIKAEEAPFETRGWYP